MSNGIIITTNAGFFARRFERYLARSIQISRRSAEVVVREQARGLIRQAFIYTPPMAGRSFFQGKKASQRAIQATISRATIIKSQTKVERSLASQTSSTPREVLLEMLEDLKLSPAALADKIRANQRPDKHYPDSAQKFYASRQSVKSVQQIFERTMGVTAAGWCTAATALGVVFPDWIGRWAGKNNGTVVFQSSETMIMFKAVNRNRHMDGATIQRALDYAYDKQANKMRNSLIKAIARGVLRREDVFLT